MNVVDIVIIVLAVLGGINGYRKGIVRTSIQLVGSAAIAILSYTFKDILADFLIDFMPFLQYKGAFLGLSSINIVVYQIVSFVVIYVLFYCLLNILLGASGLIDTLIKLTVVLKTPSKIMAGLLGILDGLVFAFLLAFVALHLGLSEKYVMESKMGIILLERTPFLSTVMAKSTLSLEEICNLVNYRDESVDDNTLNAEVLQTLIHYKIITSQKAMEIKKEKMPELEHVTFA